MNQGQTQFVYVSYIRTTPEKLWAALTKPEFTREYWSGVTMKSAWEAGASWEMMYDDGKVMDAGEILEADPPRRLVIKWRNEWKPAFKAEGYSRCTMELEPFDGAVKLTLTHVMDVANSKFITEGVSNGWPKILSNLKSLMETGSVAMTNKP
ncbi:MAG: SRPBCC family protein [Terricaulis sp.]